MPNYPVIINAKVTKYRGVISLEVRDIIKIDDTYESNIGSLKTLFTKDLRNKNRKPSKSN